MRARHDASLRAVIEHRAPLIYCEGASAEEDRSAHVRSASGVVRVAGRLFVVQDDANFLAVIDESTGHATPLALPRGVGGRRRFEDALGNKQHKWDLEACVATSDHDGTVFAFGSGSTHAREVIVEARGLLASKLDVRAHQMSALYERLRTLEAFSGSELNVEGAVLIDDTLRLFQRGNGRPTLTQSPINATCDVSWSDLLAHVAGCGPVPAIENIVQYELGGIGTIPFTFTDATSRPGDIVYTAVAEDSPDTYHDGPVAGACVGFIPFDDGREPRWVLLTDPHGEPFIGKPEGIVALREHDAFLLVVDHDDPFVPSELLTVAIRPS